MYSKGYNNDFCDLIINKVYYDCCSNYLMSVMDYLNKYEEYVRPEIKYKTYLFKDNSGLYKIGKSTKPIDRHYNLHRTNIGLKIIFIFDCDIESILHNEFNSKLVSNEWFTLNEKDLSIIYNKYKKAEIYLSAKT